MTAHGTITMEYDATPCRVCGADVVVTREELPELTSSMRAREFGWRRVCANPECDTNEVAASATAGVV